MTDVRAEMNLTIDNEGSLKDFLSFFAYWNSGIDNTDKNEVDINIVKSIEMAQSYLEEVQSLTKEEINKRASEYNEEVIKNKRHNTEMSLEKVSRMLDLINSWNPESQELKRLKLDACAMLSAMINNCNYSKPALTIMKPAEWHKRQITDANNVLQNQIKRYEFEQDRVQKIKALIKHISSL